MYNKIKLKRKQKYSKRQYSKRQYSKRKKTIRKKTNIKLQNGGSSKSVAATESLNNLSIGNPINHRIKFANDLTEFDTILKAIIDLLPYEKLYISIGGKYSGEPKFPTNGEDYPSNAIYQIIPEFLMSYRDSLLEDGKTLVILVDNFNNDENISVNTELISKRIKESNKTIDVIILNLLFNKNNINIFIEKISTYAKNYIKDFLKNFMICNFIRFVVSSENTVNTLIIEKMYIELKYYNLGDNFYIWFGYNIFFYNMIYQYKKYIDDKLLIEGMFMTKLLHIRSSINPQNVIKHLKIIFKINEKPNNTSTIKRAINNFIDITSNENFKDIDTIPPTPID